MEAYVPFLAIVGIVCQGIVFAAWLYGRKGVDPRGTWTAEEDGTRVTITIDGGESTGQLGVRTEKGARVEREDGVWGRTRRKLTVHVVSSDRRRPPFPEETYTLHRLFGRLLLIGPSIPPLAFEPVADPAARSAPAADEDPTWTEEDLEWFATETRAMLVTHADGMLEVVFDAMPPYEAEGQLPAYLACFEHLDRELEAAIGVPVVWEDPEIFTIEAPAPDTADRIRDFLRRYRPAPAAAEE